MNQAMEKCRGKRLARIREKGAMAKLRRAISARWRWWTYERWQDNRDLTILRRMREEKGSDTFKITAALWNKVRHHSTAERYQFEPGEVDVLRHINGSGALIESRVDAVVRGLADCQREVRSTLLS